MKTYHFKFAGLEVDVEAEIWSDRDHRGPFMDAEIKEVWIGQNGWQENIIKAIPDSLLEKWREEILLNHDL